MDGPPTRSDSSRVLEQLELLGVDSGTLTRAGVARPEELARHWRGERAPCAGRATLRCVGCGLEASLQFRCEGHCERSCEHAERAASALLRAIPRVPVRHWVLSLPGALQLASAVDQRFVAALCREFIALVFEFVRRRVGAQHPGGVECGGASLVHRAARALVFDVHVHALVLDGGYVVDGRGPPTFMPLVDEPTAQELVELTRAVRERLLARWRRRGSPEDRELWRLMLAQWAELGPVATTAVRRVRIESVGPATPRKVGVGARRDGFGVHAMRRIEGESRTALATLARYLVRAPVSLQSLSPGPRGILQRLPHAFADGTTHVEFAPEELARRLVALTPGRAIHRVSYHGALAPGAAAKWRGKPLQLALVREPGPAPMRTRRARAGSVLAEPECTRCGERMRVIALEELADAPVFDSARPA
ncbi:MAG: transposase [Deltaproteobacteria bacterium]|nr:transposase [Deltaproteobacteria bacterium]MBK8715835.1 transposase [Deltaproteobacteria bacterium]MBP7286565.1 transposase [Nannocystaceae bacterium]